MRKIDHAIAGGIETDAARSANMFHPNIDRVQAPIVRGSADLNGAMAAALKARPAPAVINPQRRARDSAFVIPALG